MNAHCRFTVDTALCDRAVDDLYAILRYQEFAFIERWYSGWFATTGIKALRIVGGLLSLFGLALCLLFALAEPLLLGDPRTLFAIVAFVGFVAVFFYIDRLHPTMKAWSLARADKRSRRHADKLVSIARKLAPFEANFDLQGDLLVYSRGKNDAWIEAWNRKLGKFRRRGLAMHTANVTAVFRRPRSLFPSIVILRDGSDWLSQALQAIDFPATALPNPPRA